MRTKLLPLFLCFAGIASAQTDSLSNSYLAMAGKPSDPIHIGEVVVTGTRNETDVRHLPLTVSVIDRQEIEQSMQPSVLPILTQQVPGLFITSRGIMGYGVSNGAAGGIALRGLSGGSGRMMVLIDGHPQYAGIFGHPISDAYQSFLAERVEVLRGPASVLYGSNAMGGVINIVTRQLHEEGVKTNVNLGYGSFNTLQSEVTNRIRKGRFTSLISGSYNRTDGHRSNMGFEQYGGYAKLGYRVTDNWNLRGDVNVTHFNASYPGPVSAPLLDGDQSITRGMTSFAVENKYEKTSGAASFFYNWGNHWINDGYTPSKGETPQESRFLSFDNMMGLSLYQSTQFFPGNRITVGFDWFRYGGHAWNKFVSREGGHDERPGRQARRRIGRLRRLPPGHGQLAHPRCRCARRPPFASRYRVDTASRTLVPPAPYHRTEGLGLERFPLPHPARDVHVPTPEPRPETRVDVELRTGLGPTPARQ